MADRSVTFTGIKFENPFLLSSAPPTESENNILRAFDAGWGGVVTKTIGLHPVTNVVGAKAKFMRTGAGRRLRLDEEAARRGAALVVELGAHLRQADRLVGTAHPADQGGASDEGAHRVDHGRLRQRQGARATGRRWPRPCRTPAPMASSATFPVRTWTERTWAPTSARMKGSARS